MQYYSKRDGNYKANDKTTFYVWTENVFLDKRYWRD